MNISIDHPTDRPNFAIVQVKDVRLAFSYETLVGITNDRGAWVVHENIWSGTTGKHLNWLDDGDKQSRLTSEEFREFVHTIMYRRLPTGEWV